ncbi:right-handed parallel beta-helix repeat-containing protein [Candidatus Bipolaricaulota bacterium]|nr:right-handed parallel beta-helix repeat-containing protein [Candidatus Bipolaricaulota bacterium]
MKRVGFIPLTLIAIAAISAVSSAEVRGPIVILGNADFTAANGVVSGSGNVMDPYIIAGHEIAVAEGQFYGVRIENVSASFVLRGLVVRNAVERDGAAIRIGFSAAGGTIEGCTVSGGFNGVQIVSSENISIRDSVLVVSGRGLQVVGETAEEYHHDIDETVELNGYPVLYYYGLDGETIEGKQARHLTVADSTGVTIKQCTVVDGDGIQFAFVTDSTITASLAGRDNNVPTGNAIELFQSSGNTVTSNLVKNSRLAGIQLTLSSENTITANYIAVNDTGLWLVASDTNEIVGNEFAGCYTAIWLAAASQANHIDGNVIIGKVTEDGDRRQGIVLDLALGNRIERNVISECEMGISLSAQAGANTVVGNSLIACDYGVSISGPSNAFEKNLFSLNSRGILFPETYGNSTTSDNAFSGNVFSVNGSHVYTNLDSEGNTFSRNVFLGDHTTLVTDNGEGNRWTVDGIGNYWSNADVLDEDGDGISEVPVFVYTAGAEDTAPQMSVDPSVLEIGVLGTLDRATTRIETADGAVIALDTLIAEDLSERATGFQGFPEPLLSGAPGILFVFPDEGERRFHMNNVGFDLDIAFFDAEGVLVGRSLMEANAEALYTAASPFQYALELPGGMLDDLGIGDGAKLQVP